MIFNKVLRKIIIALGYTGSKAISQISGIVIFIFAESYFSKTEFGTLTLYLSYVPLVLTIISFQSDKYLNARFYEINNRTLLISLHSKTAFLAFVVNILISISWLFGYVKIELLLISLYVSFQGINELYLVDLRFKNDNKRYIIFQLVETVLYVILVVPAILYWNYLGAIIAMIISKLIVNIKLSQYNKELSLKNLKSDNKSFLAFTIPLVISGLGLWLYQNYDRSYIKENFTIEDVGIYSYVLKIASIITLLSASVNLYLSPIFFKRHTESDNIRKESSLKQMKNITLAASFPVLILGKILIGEINLRLFFGSILYFIILSWASIESLKILAEKKTIFISTWNLISGILMITLLTALKLKSLESIIILKIFVVSVYFIALSRKNKSLVSYENTFLFVMIIFYAYYLFSEKWM